MKTRLESVCVVTWILLALIGSASLAVSPLMAAGSNVRRGRIYVSNSGDDTVSVISLTTLQVLTNIPVGDNPMGLSVMPNGLRVYVANQTDGTVSVIDTTSLSVIATISVGQAPAQLVASRDGRRVYVANHESSTISIINTDSNGVMTNVPTPLNPNAIAFHPIRDEVWIGFTAPGTAVQVRSAGDFVVLANAISFDRLYASADIAFLPDGDEVFGAEGCGFCGRFHRVSGNHSGGTITVIQQDILYDNRGIALAVAVNPVNGMAYLAKLAQNGGANRVVEFDRNGTPQIGRTITFNAPPRDLAVTFDGQRLLVANQAAQGFVSVIDTATFTSITNVSVGALPSGIAIWPTGAPVASALVTLAASDFEVNADGWHGTNTMNGPETLTYNTGGATSNSVGYISVSESQGGSGSMFLGDQRAAYNGLLRFSHKQSATSQDWGGGNFVRLGSSNLLLSFSLSATPPTTWQFREIPLNENVGWLNVTSNRFATQADFVAVLRSLDRLWIRAEFSYQSFDRSDLDDFELLGQPSGPLQPGLVAATFAGITIEGAVGRSYEIQYRTVLDGVESWQHLADVVLPCSPYLFIDETSPTGARRFYRAVLNP